MASLVDDLNALDFSIYIGGPLQAAVKAQNAASMAQVRFIQAVGFEDTPAIAAVAADNTTNPPTLASAAVPAGKKLRYVDFSFAKSVVNPDFGKTYAQLVAEGKITADPAVDTDTEKASAITASHIDVVNNLIINNVTIKVPFLTMLTMPAIRIEEITIDFNAKLTSVETSSNSSEFAANGTLDIHYGVARLKVSASYKSTSSSGTNIEKAYSLGVHVRAVNDKMPEGLDRILTMLEDSIASINK